ncbi:MAG: YraN family protein [Paracoccaceae bacterium]
MSGAVSYHAGLAAEARVAAHYQAAGRAIAARRWRGEGGEIDIVARDGDAVIFVEVKHAETHAWAAERVSDRQIARIRTAACEFVAGEPGGQDTEMRFDLALVDGKGRIDVIENVFWH